MYQHYSVMTAYIASEAPVPGFNLVIICMLHSSTVDLPFV